MPRRRRLRLPSEVLGAPAWAGTCAISASPLPVTRPGQRRPCRAGRCPASNTGRKTQIGARPSLPSGRVCACRMPFPPPAPGLAPRSCLRPCACTGPGPQRGGRRHGAASAEGERGDTPPGAAHLQVTELSRAALRLDHGGPEMKGVPLRCLTKGKSLEQVLPPTPALPNSRRRNPVSISRHTQGPGQSSS